MRDKGNMGNLMKIDIITLFPQQISDFLNYSITKRAQDQKLVEIKFHDLRRWAVDARGSVDDKPYGGGKGMILRVEPVVNAIKEIRGDQGNMGSRGSRGSGEGTRVVMFDARGEKFNQQKAFEFAKLDHLILICGHYEGFDERILNYVDMNLSIGDFVLTGGEIPACVVVDAVTRLLPGVLKEGVVENESFSQNQNDNAKIKNIRKNPLEIRGYQSETEAERKKPDSRLRKNDKTVEFEYPQFTRPEVFEGLHVPQVLLSGNHAEITKWRSGDGDKR